MCHTYFGGLFSQKRKKGKKEKERKKPRKRKKERSWIKGGILTSQQEKKINPSAIVPNVPQEIVTFQFDEDLPVGAGVLHFEFIGILSDKLAGLYRSQYKVRRENKNFAFFRDHTNSLHRTPKGTKNFVFVLKWNPLTVVVSSLVSMSLPERPLSSSRPLILVLIIFAQIFIF